MMDEKTYEIRRQQIQDQVDAASQRASAIADQGFASLFIESGWTQDMIAKREGKSQAWVSYQLCFGRFLGFITSGDNLANPPKNLTERLFRTHFERTDKGLKEPKRFQLVVDSLVENLVIRKSPSRKQHSRAIAETFSDGKWHSVEKIAEGIGIDADDAREKMSYMKQRGYCGTFVQERPCGKTVEYRIRKSKSPRVVPLDLLQKEIGPILKDLEKEGRANAATFSGPAIINLAHKLKKVIDELAK